MRRPGSPRPFPRSDRPPGGHISYIACRVHVGVACMGAGSAYKDRLALARLRIYAPAHRTPLTRESGVHLLQPAGSLVLQPLDQQSPSIGKDAPVQSGLLADSSAGSGLRSSGRARHGRDTQVFHSDNVESSCQVRRGLFHPVLTPIRLPRLQTCNRLTDANAPLRPTSRPRQAPLQPPQPPVLGGPQLGTSQHFPSGQCSGDGHAPVNPYARPISRLRDRLRNRGEPNMPASSSIAGDAVRSHRTWNLAGPAKSHPTHLWDPHRADPSRQPSYVTSLDVNDPKAFVTAGLPPRWPRVCSGKEIRHCLTEVTQRLLLHYHRTRRKPRELPTRFAQLPTLKRVAGRTATAGPPPGMLLHSKIPHKPGLRAMLGQSSLLHRRGQQAIPRHKNTLSSFREPMWEVEP